MKGVLIAVLIFAVFHLSMAKKAKKGKDDEADKDEPKRKPKPDRIPVDVNTLCDKVKCEEGHICRVVQGCGKNRLLAKAKCMSCAPKGVDDSCQAANFLRSVLTNSKRDPTRVACHLNAVPNKVECPMGSTCVQDQELGEPGYGVCCYNQTGYEGPDKVCSACGAECEAGYTCEKDIECGTLKFYCKPQEKAGVCPSVTIRPAVECPGKEMRNMCRHDQQCPTEYKCCRNDCGGTKCVLGNVPIGR